MGRRVLAAALVAAGLTFGAVIGGAGSAAAATGQSMVAPAPYLWYGTYSTESACEAKGQQLVTMGQTSDYYCLYVDDSPRWDLYVLVD